MGDIVLGEGENEHIQQERAFFERLKADPKVIGELYELEAQRMFGFLYKRCRQKELAEDLLSQTFLKFLEALPKLEWREVSVKAFLYRIASNLLVDHWRKASTRHELETDFEGWEVPGVDDPVWKTQVVLESERVKQALLELSDRDQQVIQLHYFGGLETPEIAPVLEISANHASVLLYRALIRLRKLLVV